MGRGAPVGAGKGRELAAWELFVDLVTGVVPAVQRCQLHDGELSAELYRLREGLRVHTPRLGAAGAAVTGYVDEAARLLRDELDRQRALRLLKLAASELADIAGADLRLLRRPLR